MAPKPGQRFPSKPRTRNNNNKQQQIIPVFVNCFASLLGGVRAGGLGLVSLE